MQPHLEGFRLSQQQRRLWSLHQEGDTYPAQCAIQIEGSLDDICLEQAFQQLIKRHQMLRTTFHRLPGMKTPVQAPQKSGEWRLTIDDCHATITQGNLEEHLGKEACAAFDLEQAPLLRATLVRNAPPGAGAQLNGDMPEQHLLLITLPALCADSWSLRNLVHELRDLYGELADGQAVAADEAEAVQYVQFSEWQQSLADGEDAETGAAYWQELLAALPPTPVLPLESAANASEPVSERSMAIHHMTLAAPLVAAVETLATTLETSTAAVLLAAWQTLVWRFTQLPSIVVYNAYDGRSFEMLEEALGPFVQSLPLCTAMAGDAHFSAIVRQVDEALLAGYEWQDYFSADEATATGSGNPGTTSRLSDRIGFAFTEWPAPQQVGGITWRVQYLQSLSDRFKLQLTWAQIEDEINATFSYAPARYTATEVERLAKGYLQLLQSATANADAPISTLNLLSSVERQRLVVEVNTTTTSYPQDKCIHHLFAEQATRTPERPAVVFVDEQVTADHPITPSSLSYAELDARANQLAHHLREMGVGPNVVVALCLDRSLDLIVAMLGVLKAGGAYAPLNPEHPKSRLAHQLAETGGIPLGAVVLTQANWTTNLPDFAGTVLCLDRDADQWAHQPATAPATNVTSDDLAYVLYTSGSTGTPKGVAITHRNLVNYSHFITQRLRLAEADDAGGYHFGMVSTVTADLGNTSLFPALISGGCLHLFHYEVATDGRRFAAYLTRHPLDVLKIVPSHLNALMAAGEAVLPRQYLILGGEAFSWALLDRILAQEPTCEVLNHYGPTETTVGSLTVNASALAERPRLSATVPIGRPIANTQLYILDEAQQPVPIGVPGELYIGGDGVAQGYLNHPDLTDSRFTIVDFGLPDDTKIVNSQSAIAGAHWARQLYRTGDLVRYIPAPDGGAPLVEFLGRVDNQVKIRGFRVELEEIEARLNQHPAVHQAVVLAQTEQTTGDAVVATPHLVAYVTVNDGAAFNPHELRSHLQETLPDYMLPATFVPLDKLPLTANGKVDRRALAALEVSAEATAGAQAKPAYVAPATPTEELLAGIWAKVLDGSATLRVGALDHFFNLGGHSLTAMTVVARIREVFQVDLPLRTIFEAPTLRQLAAAIDAVVLTEQAQAIPSILPIPRDRTLPLSFAQQRLWFLDQLAPGSAFYNVPIAVRLRGDLHVAALEQALAAIVRRHEILRTTFQTVAGQPVQVIAPSLQPTVQHEDLRTLPADQREAHLYALATEEVQRPFDLAQGPLFRVMLVQMDAQDHALLWTTHHIVSDLGSRTILTQEFATLYNAFVDERSATQAGSPLGAPLPVQYADYAYWQRQWLTGAVYHEQLAYWKNALAGSPSLLELPTDRPRPSVQTFHGADVQVTLPQELTTALIGLSRREGVTLYMTLLAAFQTLLHRYSGQEEINVGTPVSGRNRPETVGMVGFFLNTLVMRTRFQDNPTFRDLLRQVRTTALGAYAHQEIPFEQLVEALQPARNLSHTPLFQVSFSTVNATTEFTAGKLALPNLTLEPFQGESNTAKFDLALLMVEGDQTLTAHLEYNTDLFDRTTVEQLLQHYTHLLQAIIVAPEQHVGVLSLLSEREQQQLLVEWNEPPTQPEPMPLLQPLLEAQVARTPDKVALVFGDQTLTYGELNRRANQVAHHLQTLGVGPETLVGLCVERSPAMIVGLLGILKAGGAYLPLDPATPKERLAYLLQDSGAAVLLTQERLLAALPKFAGQVVCLDTDWATLAAAGTANPAPCVSPEHLAYVIYTSGSTGLPKGVQIEHGAIAHHCGEMAKFYELTEADRVLQFTAFTFDASLEQIFTTLLTGATLVLPDSPVWTPDQFYRQLVRHQLSVINLPTVYWQQLVQQWAEAREPIEIAALRLAIISGEQMTAEAVRRWQTLPTQEVRLLNAYGPTETTITATAYEIPTGDLPSERIPIGRPTPGKRIYILDAYGQPTPIGVPGELCIGGPHLARGYLNRPELTDSRFTIVDFGFPAETQTPHHQSRVPFGRVNPQVYKTGDLARYRPDGNIEFLGRVDYQVKVRGFRVELGEIEAVLAQYPGVRETVVIAQDDPVGKRLVAYLVAAQATPPTVEAVRAFLAQKLPDYMIPGNFVWLDALPTTPNGKLDRNALPAPDGARPALAAGYVAPRTPTEQKLAEIAAQLLRLDQVGIHDNFFDLGGHSLLATQYLARLRDAFNVELPLRTLFEKPSVVALAEEIERAQTEEQVVSRPAIKPVARETRRMKRSTVVR